MKPYGQYKIRNRRDSDRLPPFSERSEQDAEPTANCETRVGPAGIVDELLGDWVQHEGRTQRLLESLREEILAGGGGLHLRIRQVFETPREIFRLELELPDHSYQRTTFLDREALEALLEADDVRAVVETGHLGANGADVHAGE